MPFGPLAGPNLSVGVDTSSKGERHCAAFACGRHPAGAAVASSPVAPPPTTATTSPTFAVTPAPTRISDKPAGDDRLHFDRDFVGLDLEQVVALPDFVADRFEPGEDLALRNRLAELRHDDRRGHRTTRSARAAPCRRCALRSAAPGLRDDRRPAAGCAAW